MSLTPFPCTGCGACCRMAGKSVSNARDLVASGSANKEQQEIAAFPYKFDKSGACEMLNADNSCKIYDDRPDICSIHKSWMNYSHLSWRQYMELTAMLCNQMMDKAGIDKSLNVVLPPKNENTDSGKVVTMDLKPKAIKYTIMARLIKFRAWDGDDFKPLDDDGDYYFRDDGDGLRLWDKWGECKNITLLQFTGLKDKNGKEIYEGDVVKYTCPDLEKDGSPQTYTEYTEEVEFKDGVFSLEVMPVYAIADFEGEVIGNIYENPELLEKTK